MEWLTAKKEYEGLPLYLRIPNNKNIWKERLSFPKLICISHVFEEIDNKGLPTLEYNKSLDIFDNDVVHIIDSSDKGIIFLVETYGGRRNYWYYTSEINYFSKLYEKLKSDHKEKEISLDYSDDAEWEFIKEYPFRLFQ